MNNKLTSHTLSTLRIIAISSLTIFTLYTLQAWTGPIQSAPNGNVGGPLTTATSTQTKTGKLIALDFCTIAGKCLSSSAVIPPAATLSGTPASCTIASGASTCNVSLTWNITNATTPNVYNSTKGIQISALATTTSYSYSIGSGSNTIQAREGSSVLTSITETGSCASGSLWNGSSCVPTTATIKVNKPTGETVIACPISDGGSTCSGSITWSISNAVSPNLFNATAGTQITTGTGATTFTNFAHGSNTFTVRDGTTQLASDSGTAQCSGEPGPWTGGAAFWNGSICDPAWVAKASMPTARGQASATMLNNKIYVFGGFNAANSIVGTVEEYDPATNSWATRTNMITARYDTGATTVGTKIYVMGGNTSSNGCGYTGYPACHSNEEYTPLADIWTAKANIPLPVGIVGDYHNPAVTVNSMVYFMNSDATRVYDPSLNTWVAKTQMITARTGTRAVALGTDIYVLGGAIGGTNCGGTTGWNTCFTNEKYDTVANTWTTKTSMNYPLEGHTAAVVNGKIYVTGGRAGYNNGANAITQEYNPATNAWRARSSFYNRLYATTAVVNNKIYIIGQGFGWGYTPSGDNTEYDPAKDLKP